MGNDHIVFVSDASSDNRGLNTSIARCGYVVHVVAAVEQALPWLRNGRLAGVVIQVEDLPGVPIIDNVAALTAAPIVAVCPRSNEELVVTCLKSEADTVLVHPLSLLEMQARLNAALAPQFGQSRRDAETLEAGDLTINVGARVASKRGVALPLTPKEFDLLAALARRAGHVASYAELMSEVWKASEEVTPATLRVFIRCIREKLEDTATPRLVLNQRGVGYRLARVLTPERKKGSMVDALDVA